jgi:hypothetical protein
MWGSLDGAGPKVALFCPDTIHTPYWYRLAIPFLAWLGSSHLKGIGRGPVRQNSVYAL